MPWPDFPTSPPLDAEGIPLSTACLHFAPHNLAAQFGNLAEANKVYALLNNPDRDRPLKWMMDGIDAVLASRAKLKTSRILSQELVRKMLVRLRTETLLGYGQRADGDTFTLVPARHWWGKCDIALGDVTYEGVCHRSVHVYDPAQFTKVKAAASG